MSYAKKFKYSKVLITPNALELIKVSVPLMLTILSSSLMMFCDRLILANYSLEGMNAAISASISALMFQFGAYTIAFVAEIFVGNFNGSKQYHRLGEPIWQMIWFSLFMGLVFLILAFTTGQYVIPKRFEDIGINYYQWIMSGTIFPMLIATFASFYVGQGQIILVSIAAVLCNIFNIILDLTLVFGYDSWIPSLGVQGASIATVVAQAFQAILLLLFFFTPYNITHKGAFKFKFKPSLFFRCLVLGAPISIANVLEFASLSVLLHMVAWLGQEYTTVFTIGHSIFLLFTFALEGLQRGVTAVAANLIGAGKGEELNSLVASALKILVVIAVLLAIPLFIYPDVLINHFIVQGEGDFITLREETADILKWVWLFIIFDGIVWIISGTLLALGDTFSTMVIRVASIWIFCVIPTYVFLVQWQYPPVTIWQIACVYALINASVFILRYKYVDIDLTGSKFRMQ